MIILFKGWDIECDFILEAPSLTATLITKMINSLWVCLFYKKEL